MEQVLIRRLKEGTLGAYRRAAEANGRSLEAELRDVIERNRPGQKKDSAYLVALSKRLQAMTLKPGEDSTPYIRWLRDTNFGEDVDGKPSEADAGRRRQRRG